MANLLALDQGTTSSRALVFDDRGTVLGRSQREFEQIFPQPGWVEHDPRVIWETQLAVAREVLQEGACDPQSIAAIGITNQRETTLAWDRATGEPLYNAIVWQDRRTAEFCDWLKSEGHGDLFHERTGLLIDAYFSGTKLRWILDHVDGARERAAAGDLVFGTVDSWLIYKLTGGAVHATDPSNASRTLMYNIHRGEWDDELLELLDVPRAMLPEVRPSSGDFGTLTDGLLPVSLPIRGVAGDQQAALFGQRCIEPGMAKNTYGTGCFMLMHTGDKAVTSANNLLTTIAWEIDGRTSYALEGSIFVAGAVVQWLRDGLGIIAGADDVEPLARSVRDSAGVVLVPAFVGLGAPHWDSYARGTIVGLTLGSTAAHIARAALESIAFQTADVMRAMEADAGLTLPELRVDGGAVANDLLMQFQADILDVPVARPHSTEITALGAACLAGLAAGVWNGTDDIVASWEPDCRFVPTMDAPQREKLINRWHRALERARGWSA